MQATVAVLRRGLLDLATAIYRERVALADLRMLAVGTDVNPAEMPIPPSDASGWTAIRVGAHWGGPDQQVWFHGAADVPPAWRDGLGERYAVVLRLLLGRGTDDAFGWPEGLLYVNGRLHQGINRHHPDVLLRDDDVGAGRLTFDARAWSGMTQAEHHIECAEIARLDRRAEELFHLLSAGVDVVELLPPDQPLVYALADALEHAYGTMDLSTPYSSRFEESVTVALHDLLTRLADLRRRFDPADRPSITAIGHGHLDVAWLWRTRHTREKTARTFSIAAALMERYPEYRFLHTTPQVFAWLSRDYPELFERVRDAVREGAFEAAGAMWVESDCNLVAGESLVRQIFYGQRYLRETFGREYPVLWLPDAFGYSAALPQIMLKSGLTAFMTTKMSWSETNRIPMDTFRWRGLDGSEVLAHFLTTPSLSPLPPLDKVDTYNGRLVVTAVLGAWRRYRQKDVNDEVLVAFGFGDGGAGPTRQQLEQARALRQLPGVPRLQLGRADDFFAALRERVWKHPRLPVWDGELYLEYHRGTYTSQAWLKLQHRRLEAKLLWLELLDAWRWAIMRESAPDIRPVLDEAWWTLLLHEFHDILPGSSIGPVYADARAVLASLDAQLDAPIDSALQAVSAAVPGTSDNLLVFNPSPWPRTALLRVASHGAAGAEESNIVPAATDGQESALPEEPGTLVEAVGLPALGYRQLLTTNVHTDTNVGDTLEPARAAGRTLENAYFKLELDDAGEIASLIDKRVTGGRELVRAGDTCNRLEAYDDRPPHFDAWDIAATFERKRFPVQIERIDVLETGPLRATVAVVRTVLASRIEQHISLYRALPRIDFATHINWHDHHVLLKAAFPLDVRTTTSRAEMQYGSVERPMHRNTSWDAARFEVPMHRWIDASEGDYGVSLLNDGRYGYDARDATLRISLLRSATSPDPAADQGRHDLTYSLYPHLGDWRRGGTVQAAYELNRPVRVYKPRAVVADAQRLPSGEVESFVRAEPSHVVVEAVKRARDRDALVVRVYECAGARCRARVTVACAVSEVMESDLLERPLTQDASPAYEQWRESPVASHDEPALVADGWTFALRPFEVRTFLVTLV